MWTAIQYVTGILSLVAFGIAAAVAFQARKMRRDETAIEKSSQDQLLGVLDRLAERYHVDTTNLTRAQKIDIIRDQHAQEFAKLKIRLQFGLAALALLIVGALFSSYKAQLPKDKVAQGTGSAKIELDPVAEEITANLTATTTAHISPGGRARLIIWANDEPPCDTPEAYANWSNKSPFHDIKASCSIRIKRNRIYVFHAFQENTNADAQMTTLSVTYER